MCRKFTQKHYRAIAETMREAAIVAECSNMRNRDEVLSRVKSELADMFARDSGKFKRELFAKACEPDGAIWSRKHVAA